jgi:hypothetical protein
VKIETHLEPFKHIQADNVFPTGVCQDIINRLPKLEVYYNTNLHPQRFMCPLNYDYDEDIFPTKLKYENTKSFATRPMDPKHVCTKGDMDFWRNILDHIKKYFEAGQEIFKDEGNAYAYLIRDFQGYFISPHVDTSRKIMSMFFYLPRSEGKEVDCPIQLLKPVNKSLEDGEGGRSFMSEPFTIEKEIPFKENTMFAFKRTNSSFHCVQKVRDPSAIRNSLLVGTYVK